MIHRSNATREARGRCRMGIDIGGTFTDFVLLDGQGGLRFGKVLTTPEDPLRAVVAGLRALLSTDKSAEDDIEYVVHGTTLITNAVIERKGARTALLTTQGFEDLLEIGREQRYDLYDLQMRFPEPLVRRRLRIGVDERTDHTGAILTHVDADQVTRLARDLEQQGVESVAICFLHAWQNPENERRTAEAVRQTAPGIEATTSAEVLPEIREYERVSTTVLNAYVRPLAKRYLGRLRDGIADAGATGADVHVMTSSGHLMTIAEAERSPVRLIESGPAGGCLAAVYHAREMGLSELLAFDMGGTTAKACLIHDERPFTTNEFEVARAVLGKKGSGIPLRIPAIDLIEIGSGGGSIAEGDQLGLLRVGPTSAGADPGPACYGLGGTKPTVTDANLVLGYLGADSFLGGEMTLDVGRAQTAIQSTAETLGLGLVETAVGIHRIVNENMANAARIHVFEKGKDPRNYPLFAFGGAGPIHAYEVARLLGAPTFIVPRGAGVTAALGFLSSPIASDLVRTYLTPIELADWARIAALFAEMESEARTRLTAAGVAAGDMKMERAVDMRYVGQGFEVTVPLSSGAFDASRASSMVQAFCNVYRERYGQSTRDQPLEAVSWRVRARGSEPRVELDEVLAGDDAGVAMTGQRPVYFAITGDFLDTPVYDRDRLGAGVKVQGPAILEERESTIVIPPLSEGVVDTVGSVVVTMGGVSKGTQRETATQDMECLAQHLTR